MSSVVVVEVAVVDVSVVVVVDVVVVVVAEGVVIVEHFTLDGRNVKYD